MAQRRMFSPDIVCSDAFLDMPASCQSLYFQLGMYADDDGFVNPRKIMRMLGSSEDDLKILIAKRFLFPFESGVVVIKHWKVNNLVRKDWYRPTQYVEERSKLFIKENGSYTDDSTQGVQFVNESLTVRPRRLGKVSIGKEEEVAEAPSHPFSEKIRNKEPEYRALIEELAAHDYISARQIHEIVLDEFLPHWLETSVNGKKELWQKQKTFDYLLRIRTWITNYHKWQKDQRCRAKFWHRKGESCHHEKEVVFVPKVRSEAEKSAIKSLAQSKSVTHD